MKHPYIAFILSMFIFGSNGIIASHIPLSSYEIVLCRCLLGGVCLLAVALYRHELSYLTKDWHATGWLVLGGLFMSGNWMFLYEAYQQIGVGLATIMCYAGPIIVIILSRFIFHEALTLPKILGIIMVTGGMLCINGTDFQSHGLSWGMACGFLAALCFALLVVSVKKSKGIPNVIFAASQLLIAGFVVSIVTVTAHEGPVVLDGLAILYILILGVFNSGFACLLYFGSVQMLPAQTVSICGYIEPLSALTFSIIFLGETLTVLQWSGAALVLGGLFIAEFWRSQRLHNRGEHKEVST